MFIVFIGRLINGNYYYYQWICLQDHLWKSYNENTPVLVKHLLKISSENSWLFGNPYTVLVEL